ncbi:hypothetical protein SISSUDRAFT_1020026 [Sistotremastrum suecicum HHB10207 ss-3]|uniref:F-box domain-containing protein n=1 Tax=Sistotremastrum suecicum HHB10207 ss-3 TaxID=1314776 RepID=A0A166EFV1_9AGAM|nr:hypothetical protein SISSUDRAFT_1020026 [Sistotremastrum suecicum HHB10207 ss-3]
MFPAAAAESGQASTSTVGPQDELSACVAQAIQSLPVSRKADFLLKTALTLVESGQYGEDVENYLEIFLKTPGLAKDQMVGALLARGRARRSAGKALLAKAQQDFEAVARLDPSNREVAHFLRSESKGTSRLSIHFTSEPAHRRTPPEVWSRIASFIPRFHLRNWLYVSAFHRDIAQSVIFRTMDIYFGEEQQDNMHRGMDIFDRVKWDQAFARKIKTLRLHWAYEEGDMLDVMTRIFRNALPSFIALREFEWIGYPELRVEMVQAILSSHPNLQSLGLIGWHFDAEGVSRFSRLTKFTLRAEDDDGFADMGEVRTVLDNNSRTLRHLCLGAYLARNHSWDTAFQSVTIKNLTHLDLVDTRISHIVLARIAHAHQLQSLTLHGTFEEPSSASVVFGSDHIIDGRHTFLPHLEAFRFVLVGHDHELVLFQNVVQFLRQRPKLRRLDLGNCPWDLVSSVLPDLVELKVLRVRIANLTAEIMGNLVKSLPKDMVAIHLAVTASDKSLHLYASQFASFPNLHLLHLSNSTHRRPLSNMMMSEKDFLYQTDLWMSQARHVAAYVPSLDFLGWNGEHYVVVRGEGSSVQLSGASGVVEEGSALGLELEHSRVELKELPARRRLDCSKGVDLGSEDACWLERKDVPIDYELPSTDAQS